MPNILFVDDEPHNLAIPIGILEEVIEDCNIHIAETAHECILWLMANSVDLLVMDVFLPLGTQKKPDESSIFLTSTAIVKFQYRMVDPDNLTTNTVAAFLWKSLIARTTKNQNHSIVLNCRSKSTTEHNQKRGWRVS